MTYDPTTGRYSPPPMDGRDYFISMARENLAAARAYREGRYAQGVTLFNVERHPHLRTINFERAIKMAAAYRLAAIGMK